jgi:hypothetical protein
LLPNPAEEVFLRELHPGIFKKGITVFEVPDSVARADFKILIPEKGLSKQDRKTAMLFLFPNKPKPSSTLTLKPTPTPTPSKSKSHRTKHPETASWGPGNPDYEELRRKILLRRPWGTPMRDYDLDNYFP